MYYYRAQSINFLIFFNDKDIINLKIFPAHSAILRENSQYRTRLRIAERERNRREEELKRLLTLPQSTKSVNNNSKLSYSTLSENRIEMMALKRKILLYERLLKEKTRENTYVYL